VAEQNRRELMQLAAAGALVSALGTSPAQAQTIAGPIVDANMHWLPENLFTDEQLLSAFVESVPREYGIRASWRRCPASRCARSSSNSRQATKC